MKQINNKIKIIFASRPQMLSDVIKNMVEHQHDMQIVGKVVDPIELLFAVKEKPVDVVIIVPIKSERVPRICSQLLLEHPLLKILTLSEKSKRAVLYQSGVPDIHIDEPSTLDIFGAIRDAMHKALPFPDNQIHKSSN
jgi:DNA-binding NarL/FixJ family response regulator